MKTLSALMMVALWCAMGPGAQARAAVTRDRVSDEQVWRLTARSGLIVSARLDSKPERSNIVISDSYSFWMLRLRPSLVFKGRRPTASVLDAEFDTESGHVRGIEAQFPPSRVQGAYLVFLADRSSNLPRLKVLGMKPYSRSLALQLRRVQALRPKLAALR